MEVKPETENSFSSKINELKQLLRSDNARQNGRGKAPRLNEQTVSNLFRSTDVVTLSTLQEGRFLYVNDAFLEMAGFRREEAIGRTSLELGIWVDPGQRSELIALLREKGMVEDYHAMLRTRNGDVYSAIQYMELYKHEGEECIISVLHDAANFVRVAESLRRERNKLKGILDAMEDGVCIVDHEYSIEYANPSIIEWFGPIAGRRCFDYFHGEDAACPSCRIKDVFDGKTVRWEWHSPRIRKTFDLLDIRIKDDFGRISKLEIFHDITDRKLAREALQKSEKKYRTLVETMSDGLVQGENGLINYVNERLCEMLGYAHEEMIGRELVDFLDRESRSNFPAQVDRISKGELGSFEMQWMRKDGRKISTISSPMLILNGDEQIKSCFAVVHDITERKFAEEELKRSYEQVRNLSAHLQSVREMERTNVAREIHDELGQALTALKMDIFWCGGRLRKDQKGLRGKTRSMLALINKTIKTVKRISAELRPCVLDDLGLTAAIEWQASEFHKRAGVPCSATFDPATIALDHDRSTAIFRIFQETLTNVARHSGATRVEALLEERNGDIALTVSDNGKGITRKQISSTRSFGIIGMRERVSFLGGEVRITGSPKKGTRVTVTIPKVRGEEAPSDAFAGDKTAQHSAEGQRLSYDTIQSTDGGYASFTPSRGI